MTDAFEALESYVADLVIFQDGDRMQLTWTCKHPEHRGYMFSVRVHGVAEGLRKLLAIETAAHQVSSK